MEFISHLLNDPSFWVGVSTVLCFGFIGWKAYKPILQGLDARAASIRHRLEEADALRAEAEALLEEYKQKSENAMHEAEEIVENAKRRAEQTRVQMEADLNDMIARQENAAKMRIARMEQEAIEAVKSVIIGTALKQVQEDAAKEGASSPLNQSLEKIVKTLH